MKEETIKQKFVGKRSKAHVYIMKDGSSIINWPLTERNVWATKMEQKKPETKGLMIHVELNYEAGGSPSEEQYDKLADLYLEAVKQFGSLVIVPHSEVDRGIADGHSDPENFDFEKLYKLIKDKGFDADSVEKIDPIRYKVPNQADQESVWPPGLKGRPKRKPPNQPQSI